MIQHVKEFLDSIDGDERFLMTLGAGIVNTALCVGGYITPDNYVTLTLGTVAVFIGASSYTAGVKMKADANVAINKESEEGETERA